MRRKYVRITLFIATSHPHITIAVIKWQTKKERKKMRENVSVIEKDSKQRRVCVEQL